MNDFLFLFLTRLPAKFSFLIYIIHPQRKSVIQL